MIKAAVIGAGRMGKIHATAYAGHRNVELVGVCDVVAEKADDLAVRHAARSYDVAERMLEVERPEIVSVCTDAAHHLASVMTALEAGANVLCEKPMSGVLQDIETMIWAAKEKNLLLGTNFNHRFARVAQLAKERVEGGGIGEICFVNMWLTIALAAEVSRYFHLRSLHGHSFDMLRYLAGEISQVHGFLSKPSGRRFYSNCAVGLLFECGAVGAFVGSYDMSNLHPMERVEVGGTKGRLVLDNVTAGLTYYRHDREEAEVWTPVSYTRHEGRTEYDFNITVEKRIDAFLEAVVRGTPDPAPAEDALAATKLIEATIRSFETGRAAPVDR